MSSPLRVLHVFGAMDRGGAETMVMNLYRQMDPGRIQFDFAVQTGREGHYDAEIESLGGRILRHPAPAEAGWRAWAEVFRRHLRERGPFTAVHSHVHLFSGLVMFLSSRHGIPVRVSHSHSTGTTDGASLRRLAYERCMRLLIRRCSTHMLGCSRQACEALFGAGFWRDERVRVSPNAISLAEYAVKARDANLLRAELRLAPGTPLIGQVGSFTLTKNHAFSIRVFERLSARLPDAHFVIAGDGSLRSDLESRIRAAGLEDRVHLLGVRTDIPSIMAALDLLLMPSLWEGLPVVLIEAQAAGVPCVVSDRVTAEADLGLGLVHFSDLQSGTGAWAEESLDYLQYARPAQLQREQVLRRAGYDAADAARRLSSLYQNRAAA